MNLQALTWSHNRLIIIDQRLLPHRLHKRTLADVRAVHDAIKTLAVRGAPLIGIAAGFGLYLGMRGFQSNDTKAFFKALDKNIAYLASARPTAVNLEKILMRITRHLRDARHLSVPSLKERILKEAQAILREEEASSRAMGLYASSLIKKHDVILTHCNTGFLATAGYGTALAGIYFAHRQKKGITVYADETRPLLQGARLTYWELLRHRIRAFLLCDNMAGYLMAQGKIDKIFVGADRIALNGDTANKIGTYSLAVLAKAHKVPFYVVAPTSTFDTNAKTGKSFPIEHRHDDEVTHVCGTRIAPRGARAYNPSFDVTPARYITAIVTEKKILRPAFTRSIKKIIFP